MKKYILTLIVATSLTGCASFSTNQVDERTNETTGEKTKVSTKVTVRTFFDAKSQLANSKATQTEKSQGASLGAISNESSGTNAVNVLNAVGSLLQALPK